MRIPRWLLAWSILLAGCQRQTEVTFDLTQPMPDQLSALSLFQLNEGRIEYSNRVIPYALNAPLFSDYALKERAIYVPDGERAVVNGGDVFSFPVGSIIIKSFVYPKDMRVPERDVQFIETRLFVHYSSGWKPFPFVWNEEQTEATLQVEGDVRHIEFIDVDGVTKDSTYLIPQKNQCFECHEMKDEQGRRFNTPIGPRPRYLNRPIQWQGEAVNQLDLLVSSGVLASRPEISDDETATEMEEFFQLTSPTKQEVDRAARDYLDINCAHCHRPNGISGITSQLFLNIENTDLFHLGYCKRPGSAGEGTGGLEFDIVPGSPEESILHYRVDTENVGAMMPMIGRSLRHEDGAELIHAWIKNMPIESCKE